MVIDQKGVYICSQSTDPVSQRATCYVHNPHLCEHRARGRRARADVNAGRPVLAHTPPFPQTLWCLRKVNKRWVHLPILLQLFGQARAFLTAAPKSEPPRSPGQKPRRRQNEGYRSHYRRTCFFTVPLDATGPNVGCDNLKS